MLLIKLENISEVKTCTPMAITVKEINSIKKIIFGSSIYYCAFLSFYMLVSCFSLTWIIFNLCSFTNAESIIKKKWNFIKLVRCFRFIQIENIYCNVECS